MAHALHLACSSNSLLGAAAAVEVSTCGMLLLFTDKQHVLHHTYVRECKACIDLNRVYRPPLYAKSHAKNSTATCHTCHAIAVMCCVNGKEAKGTGEVHLPPALLREHWVKDLRVTEARPAPGRSVVGRLAMPHYVERLHAAQRRKSKASRKGRRDLLPYVSGWCAAQA